MASRTGISLDIYTETTLTASLCRPARSSLRCPAQKVVVDSCTAIFTDANTENVLGAPRVRWPVLNPNDGPSGGYSLSYWPHLGDA